MRVTKWQLEDWNSNLVPYLQGTAIGSDGKGLEMKVGPSL